MASTIRQRDAQELAAGYSSGFRKVEIASIVSFWVLMAVLAWRLSSYAGTYPWLLAVAFVTGYFAADFVSGLVHWMADTWGSPDMPVLGKTLIRPFREHHVDQMAITRHDYIETNGANCLVSLPPALIAALCPIPTSHPWQGISLFLVASTAAMIFWVMMTNQFHKWSHVADGQQPRAVALLQKWHVILPQDHHQIHHTPPFASYYSITSGWLNWPLHTIGFYRHLERAVTAVTGALPRRDDIGAEAAWATAPVTRPPSPSGSPLKPAS